jgi:hypothetical protein
MTSWAEFEAAAPEIAREGRRLLVAPGHGSGLLATVREGSPPRIHPVSVDVIDGELWVFVLPSPKLTDLLRDRRYALHTQHDLAAPDEFMVRGWARHIEDDHTRAAIGSQWHFEVDETYALFALSVESAVFGARGPDEWPPRYSRWSAGRG